MRRLPLPVCAALIAAAAAPAWAQTPAAAPAPVVAPAVAPPVAEEQRLLSETPPDPLEKLNRGLYGVNRGLDRAFFRPLAMGYRAALPAPVRRGLRNMVGNLGEPVVAVNDLAQGRVTDAQKSLYRFTTNSVLGGLGFFDVAADAGVEAHRNGFGLTLGRYGVAPGPYLFLPFVGPTTFRDAIGGGVDSFTSPLQWTRFDGRKAIRYGRTAVGGLDAREQADADLLRIDSTATDPYATLRSLYLQNRQAEIAGEDAAVDIDALPDFGADPAGAAAPATPADPAVDTSPAAPPAPDAGTSAPAAETPAPEAPPAP